MWAHHTVRSTYTLNRELWLTSLLDGTSPLLWHVISIEQFRSALTCKQITRKVGPALAAGCTVVAKSPGETPFTAAAMAELAHRAGIPPGVVNFVTALKNTAEVGETITASPTVRKVSFTGSTGVGKLLMKQSADTLKKLSFELGGNAPFVSAALIISSIFDLTTSRSFSTMPTSTQPSTEQLHASSALQARPAFAPTASTSRRAYMISSPKRSRPRSTTSRSVEATVTVSLTVHSSTTAPFQKCRLTWTTPSSKEARS